MKDGLGLTAGETARVLGISRVSFWRLRRARPDCPRPVSGLWPGQRPLFDRAAWEKWWREQTKGER